MNDNKPKENIAVGVDIGGSHITTSLVNLEDFSLVPNTYVRKKIDSQAEAIPIIQEWSDAIKSSLDNFDNINKRIGIAMPGPFDYKKGISYMQSVNKYGALYKLNVKEMLSTALGIPSSNIKFNNDAACFLQGEIYSGDLSKHDSAIGLTLGTGMGSAYMVDKDAVDADLWKTPFKTGIIEDYISSRWFVNEFKIRTGISIKDVKELSEDYGAHEVTKALFNEFSSNLSVFLYRFLKQWDAEVIILGGNICKAESFFLRNTQRNLYEQMNLSIPIYLSALGENAALIGAASLFYQQTKQTIHE